MYQQYKKVIRKLIFLVLKIHFLYILAFSFLYPVLQQFSKKVNKIVLQETHVNTLKCTQLKLLFCQHYEISKIPISFLFDIYFVLFSFFFFLVKGDKTPVNFYSKQRKCLHEKMGIPILKL